MPDNATYDAFPSHSHQDAEIVEVLAKRLEDDAGGQVWLSAANVSDREAL